jgi:phosphoenolpyruvate carboxylase
MASYRRLIDDEGFWPWYTQVTPIRQISRLPIASRPVSRKAGSEVDFAGLRAIPWVFAWTQTRYMVPGWFGLGGALEEPGLDRDALGALYRGWPFFRLLIDNAQREMARARLIIAGRYGALGEADCGRFHEAIAGDFERVRELILEMTGESALLDNNAVIRNTIDFRNPYTDVLNLLQMDLMRRYDEAAPNAREGLRQALFLSINGIAAAMQSTG